MTRDARRAEGSFAHSVWGLDQRPSKPWKNALPTRHEGRQGRARDGHIEVNFRLCKADRFSCDPSIFAHTSCAFFENIRVR